MGIKRRLGNRLRFPIGDKQQRVVKIKTKILSTFKNVVCLLNINKIDGDIKNLKTFGVI